jgi:glucose/arabinose dehydrogenase
VVVHRIARHLYDFLTVASARRRARRLVVALSVVLVATAATAGTLPGGFTEVRVSGLVGPTAMALAPDGRLFVGEQRGTVRVIKNGVLLPTPFLTLAVDADGERGLLGIAFDPDFAGNGFVYVYYTVPTAPVHNRVSRVTADGDVAVPGSEQVIFELDDLGTSPNHNGGAMHFGLDGRLYVAVGDNSTPTSAQTLANLKGKILRIDADGSIPADNPFYASAAGANRAIWALGLRNPFTFAVHPHSGAIYINDVGDQSWEEINDGIAGANYGWPDTEGPTSNPSFRTPLFAYRHGTNTDQGCAITGGAFYEPFTVQFPAEYVGDYFFADYCSGWIKRYHPASDTVDEFATGLTTPVDLQVAADGSLYALEIDTGTVSRIVYTASLAPSVTTQPADRTVPEGRPVTFSVTASGEAPLAYQWQRDGVDIAGATSASHAITSVAIGDSGATFRCVVSNAFGTATSQAATLTVTVNRPPTASITLPAAGALYSAGETIEYAGTGSDPEDGASPPGALTWRVDFHHDDHTHPFRASTSGAAGGSFTIPTTGETSANVWYRIHLSVTDADGLSETTFRDVRPRTVTLQLATSPPGLQLTLDGQPRTEPVSILGVTGFTRTLGVVSPQTVGDVVYVFGSWSDGGAATHDVATPVTTTAYTVSYVVAQPPGAATLVSPSGPLVTTTPVPTWNAAAGATEYLLWLDDSSGGRLRRWYTATQAGCAAGTGTCSIDPGITLTPGAGRWWVVTANAFGSGPWSAALSFTIPGPPPPAAATLVAPSGPLATAMPTFTWSAAAGATQYLLWLDDSSGGRLRRWFTAMQASCADGTGTCSIDPGIALTAGAGRWWIIAANASGNAPWSASLAFTIPGPPPPPAATLLAPSGPLATATPTFTWNAATGATQYLLWLDDSSGGRLRRWFSATEAGCAAGTGTCSVSPGIALAPGAGQWWIVTANDAGSGPWSASLGFTAP